MTAANPGSMRNSAFSQFWQGWREAGRDGWRDALWSWYFGLFLIPTMTLAGFLDLALEGPAGAGRIGPVLAALATGATLFSLARAVELASRDPRRQPPLGWMRLRTLRRILAGIRTLATTAVGAGALLSLAHPPLHAPWQAAVYLVTFTLLCLFCVRMYLELSDALAGG